MVWAPEAPWQGVPGLRGSLLVPGSTWAPWSFLFLWAPLAKKPDRTCSTKIEGRTLENEVYKKLAEKANEELEMELKEALGEKMELYEEYLQVTK